MDDDVLSRGRAFIEREGRLVERRLAMVLLDDADPAGVVDAVRAHRNADGGFGHGLEPDKRCPDSLPIDVEQALDVLLVAGVDVTDPDTDAGALVRDACDWLASVAGPDGSVPLAFPVIEEHPRAEHWSEWTYRPGLNPTAGLAGRLHALHVRHPWLDRATRWTWERLDAGFDESAHSLSEVLVFLAAAPDRERAERVGAAVDGWLASASLFRADPADPSYGLTPLHLADSPDSPWRLLFDDATIEGHLDHLAAEQGDDGGWPISWEPPGTAATVEWRGIETLRALRVLGAYGRV